MIVVSGIAATTRGGTGRLLLGMLEEQAAKSLDARFVYVGNRANVARSLVVRDPLAVGRQALVHYWRRASRHWLIRRDEIIKAPRLLVLHPQEIGTRWLDRLIVRRAKLGRATEIFVLDASFYCIRSYNHLDGEDVPCLRCLRSGPAEAQRFGCQPFPIRDSWASVFVRRLRDHARLGTVEFWTQTEGYRDLLEHYAGAPVKARVAGLWTDDFADLGKRFPAVPALADIVYHGSWLEAKGARWALSLAAEMPEKRFLFPCQKPSSLAAPPNALFRPLTWESGLAEQVQATPLCLVPSLWTAPIEGALVKSIAHAPATAVIDNPHGFTAELPGNLLLRLPSDVRAAGDTIRRMWPWRVDQSFRDDWVQRFTTANSGLLERLMRSPPQ